MEILWDQAPKITRAYARFVDALEKTKQTIFSGIVVRAKLIISAVSVLIVGQVIFPTAGWIHKHNAGDIKALCDGELIDIFYLEDFNKLVDNFSEQDRRENQVPKAGSQLGQLKVGQSKLDKLKPYAPDARFGPLIVDLEDHNLSSLVKSYDANNFEIERLRQRLLMRSMSMLKAMSRDGTNKSLIRDFAKTGDKLEKASGDFNQMTAGQNSEKLRRAIWFKMAAAKTRIVASILGCG